MNKARLYLTITMIVFLLKTSLSQTVTQNTQSTHNGFFYSFWNDFSSGSASMTLGAAGNYSTTWSNIGNFTSGKGWAVGKADRTICFSGSFDGGSNGFLAVYGWTKNELIEYYVVESYGSWTPPGGTSIGTVTSDGGTYKIYKTQRVNQPSIVGTATFYQFWSVRTSKRSSGTVTFANHVAAWKALGMNLGTTWDYQIMESEGYKSSGSSNITVSECGTTGPSVLLTAPNNNASYVAPAATITLTASATVTSGSVSKVEFYSGTTKLGEDASSPYSYAWTNVPAGTYSITAVATDKAGNKATTPAITINVLDAYAMYKTPTAITIDGTADAVWSNASVKTIVASHVIAGTVSNAADLSTTARFLWDNSNLYVYADINDESLKNESSNFYDDDGVEIYIDANNDKSSTYDANDVQFSFGWNDGSTVGSIPSGHSTAGIVYSLVTKSGGYVLEAKIPWATIPGTPSVDKLIGIDFMVNDDDDGSTRDAKLSWNAATDDAWQNASLFGIARLKDLVSCTAPAEPTVASSQVTYTQNAQASALTATGANLLWYTASSGDVGTSVAPTPSTATIGTTSYYVSQTVNLCESNRAKIDVMVVAESPKIALKAGWNYIGCPLAGSTDVAKALSSIWSHVLVVKNLDSFYDKTSTLNSLSKVDWGVGYMVKVDADCTLDWVVR